MANSRSRRRLVHVLVAAAVVVAGLVGVPQVAHAADPVPISVIQGSGAATPAPGTVYTTTPSVVTAVYASGPGSLNGFVIQTAGTGGPGRDLSKPSDAIFVYFATTPFTVRLGDVVSVTGTAGEFQGLTQLTRPAVTPVTTPVDPVRPVTGLTWENTASQRENLESMLFSTDQTFTVSETYPLLPYGEVGLSSTGLPLQPTEVARPNSAAAIAQAARNAAIRVNLDDGSNRGYTRTATLPGRQLPYLTPDHDVAIGDRATITRPVIVDYRNNLWKFNPTLPVEVGSEPATITHRVEPKPAVGGAFSVASFNVLNFFTTTGQGRTGCRGEDLAADGTYNVTVGCDVRGAWDAADLNRQQAKIVTAINQLDASVTGLMEIENSIKLGERTDEALASLVAALNEAAGVSKWSYVASSNQLQPVADQDFITSALIYQPAEVRLNGKAYALGAASNDDGPFGNARTPIAASFTPVGGTQRIVVAVNHFKSKGSTGAVPKSDDDDSGDGQSYFNGSRVRQAEALRDWIPSVQVASQTVAVALIGDFNAYSHEDPIEALRTVGYTNAAPEDQYSYSFGGTLGSLDHVLLNSPARERMTGSDVWNINSVESTALEYSAYRTTLLDYDRPDAKRSSDHDPVIVGFGLRPR